MTAEELIELIKHSNIEFASIVESDEVTFANDAEKDSLGLQYFLGRFADAIVREEREECAKECESLEAYVKLNQNRSASGDECAGIIRARNDIQESEEESEE